MVYRIFVEKRPAFAGEAKALLSELTEQLGIASLKGVRILNRYDVEGISEDLFRSAVKTVFSEPQTDDASEELRAEGRVLTVEYLPGQFDMRADSAAQCIQIISQGERPLVRSARVYCFAGNLSEEEFARIRKHLINPVEAREASAGKPETLRADYPEPAPVPVLTGFREMDEAGASRMLAEYRLAMDRADLLFTRDHFRKEGRDPSLTELRVLDTYWSDHCRHTTFLTELTEVTVDDPLLSDTWERYLAVRKELGIRKPVTLMDLGTIAAKWLKKQGKLPDLDESDEINACTVKITAEIGGKKEPWLLLFKNETHNHPTEIEPFGGAATCIGGAIRDPLSGRAFVHGAMRVTGAADPTVPVEETLPGKLPQRTIVTRAAQGYSSYGNQIGLATGLVDEFYHPGFAAKRMEIGAVVAAAPAAQVRRETPAPGDKVILLGGATGRDGIGGATGSSKAHNVHSVETCGAEVQKGNAPEERKLQRLFRNPEASRLIKRCNDFGAGGVSVAIGELADGLAVDLDRVPRKYEGLDGTELAISESQERMAVVVAAADTARFLELASKENLSAVVVAQVTEEPRLVMNWRGTRIVDLDREFLSSNGARRSARAIAAAGRKPAASPAFGGFRAELLKTAGSLSFCSRRGLSERFDSTIGAGTVFMPFGGARQRTPLQSMAHLLPAAWEDAETCSVMAYGYDPYISEADPFRGGYLAVAQSLCRLAASGADTGKVWLSFQEYFKKLGADPKRWGEPLAALLGAFRAQTDLGIAAIGGKDSMSGSFEDLDVPPTLVSFAVTADRADALISPELKTPGSRLLFLEAEKDAYGLPDPGSLRKTIAFLTAGIRSGKFRSVWAAGRGGIAEAAFRMALGNGLGVRFADFVKAEELFVPRAGAFVIEAPETVPGTVLLGEVTAEAAFVCGGETVKLAEAEAPYEARLESVFPAHPVQEGTAPAVSLTVRSGLKPRVKAVSPRVLIPVFPGTNCEYDSAAAVRRAGLTPEVFVIRNRSAEEVRESAEVFAAALDRAQILFIPGGFSGGDEPDGSGKFITAFLRNPRISERLITLLEERDGLALGICNGFQALIKLGLVPFGRITEPEKGGPTLTFNTIGRHQSKIVWTRVASVMSPWLLLKEAGDIVNVPISHGEGRFAAEESLIRSLAENGQIATQYADAEGRPTMDIDGNPNGSLWAVEGITSPDGRIFGKMGHSERVGRLLYRNVPGDYDLKLFESAALYFA